MYPSSGKVSWLLFAFLAIGSVTGCRILPRDGGSSGNAAEAARSEPARIPVGTVHLVDAEGGFVLVQSSRFLDVEPERELFVAGADGSEVARLRVSPARKGSFLTADILRGTPQVGNHVLMEHRSVSARDEATEGDDDVQVLE